MTVSLYKPTHRAENTREHRPTSTCTGGCTVSSRATFCPKHNPGNYTSHMAHHCPDSFS